MIEYKSQNCAPDIVSFGKMLTGGYLTFAATLTTKKIYDSFEHVQLGGVALILSEMVQNEVG